MRNFLKAIFAVGAATMAGVASAAATVDYSTLTSTAMTEVGSAVTGALPLAGLVLGVGVGFKIYKRFTK